MARAAKAQGTTARTAAPHVVVWLGFGLLGLLALAAVGAFAVDAVEVTAPALAFEDRCGHPNAVLSEPDITSASCEWGEAMSSESARTMHIQIDETESGAFQASATITTVPGDPLVAKVRHGDGRDANSFFAGTLGSVSAGDNTFIWSPPTVTTDAANTTAVVSTTGQPFQPSPAGTLRLRVFADAIPGTVTVTTKDLIIDGLAGDGAVSDESAHAVTVENPAGDLRITVEPGAPQQFAGPPGPAGSHWLSRAASTAWQLVSGFAGLIVPSAAWITVFLAGRLGGFGSVGRRPAWRRMERVLGVAVVADLAVSACFQVLDTEGPLNVLYANSPWPDHISRGLRDVGLWYPNGSPNVSGGTVLLIALAVGAAAWNPRRRERPARRGRAAIAVLAVLAGIAAAASAFLILALTSPSFAVSEVLLPDGTRQDFTDRPLTALVIPVATAAFLLVVFLAGAWIVGGQSAAAASRPRPAPTWFGRTRTVISGLAFGTAAAVVGMGLTAFFALRRGPLHIDALNLWGSGTIAWMLVFCIFGIAVAMLLPRPAGPQPGAGPAGKVVGTVLISLAFMGLILPLWLIETLVSHAADDGPDASVSGAAVLVMCLIAATALVTAAAIARRPQPAARAVIRHAWLAPLIVLLAVGATISSDSGYLPAALRWGVLIAAGTSLGLALSRLTALAVGPLRLPNARVSRRLATVLVAASVAVPWGELGHGVQVGWWDLITYANRLDAVLPLVLVAAAVVALRRIGLLPGRDEAALAGHRHLGMALWVVVLSASYSFGGTADWETTATLVTAALAAWALMPRTQVRRAAVVLSQSEQESAAAVRRALTMGTARRVLPTLTKTMRDKVAAGEIEFAEAQEKVAALEDHTSEDDVRGAEGVGDTELAFGALISPRPWVRARWATTYAAAAGAPWVVLGLAGASVSLGSPEGYPELALVSAVAPLVLRWVGYGLLFGYFFPLLRGRTGLGKSISFFVAAGAPSVLSALASPHGSGRPWHSAALLGVQLLIFSLTMGLLADLAVLRRNGFAADRLVDLHSLWTVSAWASSVVVAVGTGVATIIVAGLQPFVIGVITPSQPSTPPAAVTHQQS